MSVRVAKSAGFCFGVSRAVELVEQAAKRKPDHVAYTFMGKKTTYTQFMRRIEAAAKGLYKMGIRKGDRVTICMANTPQALD